MARSPFHPGERAVQARAGVEVRAERIGRGIREQIPTAAAAFLAERPFVVVASVDGAGRPWCSVLVGDPGFVHAADDRTVVVGARPPDGDPLGGMATGAPVGMLAVDPSTRRRMRVNGTARPAPDGSFSVRTDQVYANCPKYITPRDVGPAIAALAAGAAAVDETGALSAGATALVAASDTCFLATVASSADGGGVDASHRGGPRGFVSVEGDRRLRWRDLEGNAMFQSLGNIERNPRAGLLFVDWVTGATVQVTGDAGIEWGPEGERAVVVHAAAVRMRTPGGPAAGHP